MSLSKETVPTSSRQALSTYGNTAKLLAFGFSELDVVRLEESETDGKLTIMIEKALWYLQKDNYNAFEQILYLALKTADGLRNYNEITYVYELLANGAFMNKEYIKARHLFIKVIKRMSNQEVHVDDGHNFIFTSLKLSKIHELLGDDKNAKSSYKFCIHYLEKKLKIDPENKEVLNLYVMTFNTYGHYLTNKGKFNAASIFLIKAYQSSVKLNGEVFEMNANLLNDLGTLYYVQGKANKSLQYFKKAEKIGRLLPGMKNFSMIYINLSYMFLKEGKFKEAKKYCMKGMKNAMKHCDDKGKKEAKLCLAEIQHGMKNKA